MTSRKHPGRNVEEKSRIEIEGTEQEIAAVERMLAGGCLVGAGRDGVPLTTEVFEKIALVPDPLISQNWPSWGPDGEIKGGNPNATLGEFSFVKQTFNPHRFPQGTELKPELLETWRASTVSIFVWGLTGYDGEAVYAERAWKMGEAGFVPLRSPRDERGKIWEKWFLPGVWAGKGPLADTTLAEACRWLCREIRPGSIDLVTQRFALAIE